MRRSGVRTGVRGKVGTSEGSRTVYHLVCSLSDKVTMRRAELNLWYGPVPVVLGFPLYPFSGVVVSVDVLNVFLTSFRTR